MVTISSAGKDELDALIEGMPKVLSQEDVDTLLKGLTPKDKAVRTHCLDKAKDIINGDRRDSYGTPKASFNRIADYWTNYLSHTENNRRPLEAHDVAIMMVLFKIAREEYKHSYDNCVDICGYTALLDDMSEEREG